MIFNKKNCIGLLFLHTVHKPYKIQRYSVHDFRRHGSKTMQKPIFFIVISRLLIPTERSYYFLLSPTFLALPNRIMHINLEIQRQLKNQSYSFCPMFRLYIPKVNKPGRQWRPITQPAQEDRVFCTSQCCVSFFYFYFLLGWWGRGTNLDGQKFRLLLVIKHRISIH